MYTDHTFSEIYEILNLFGKEYKPGKIIIGKINCFFDQGKTKESTLFD